MVFNLLKSFATALPALWTARSLSGLPSALALLLVAEVQRPRLGLSSSLLPTAAFVARSLDLRRVATRSHAPLIVSCLAGPLGTRARSAVAKELTLVLARSSQRPLTVARFAQS